MSRQCEFYGHVWGRGSRPGVLVCVRDQRCAAQAVCIVCTAGVMPTGSQQAYCSVHTSRVDAVPAPQRRAGSAAAGQLSFW